MVQLAGEDILASDIWTTRYVLKTVSEAVTSSATPQNDDELFIALTPGKWRIEAFLSVTGASAGGIRVAWTTSGTITSLTRSGLGAGMPGAGETQTGVGSDSYKNVTFGLGTVIGYGGLGGSATVVVQEDLLLDCTVAGTLTLQWCQSVSNATPTNVAVGSRLMITQVEAV